MKAVIDIQSSTVTFSGNGTFESKDKIKELGNAQWNKLAKSWTVTLDKVRIQQISQLSQIFPGLEIEQLDGEVVLDEQISTAPNNAVVDGVSVSEFMSSVTRALNSAFRAPVLVYGVLSSVKRTDRSEAVFLELSDPDARDKFVKCVIWEGENKICAKLHELGFRLEKDLQVMFRASVSLNAKGGQISLKVIEVVAEYTVAKLAALRELTNQRLQKEGLFALNKQLPIPFLPLRLGILTSAAGTVINDFLSALNEAQFVFSIHWVQVSVQGKDAKSDILRGMTELSEDTTLDLILIFRGGGSPAELAIFNDYDIAKAVCLSPIPVLSAIGHEADQSSTQDVSCRAFGVPKDIGHFLARMVLDLRQRFREASQLIGGAFEREWELWNERVHSTRATLLSAISQLCSHVDDRFLRVATSLPSLFSISIERVGQRVADIALPLVAFAERGYLEALRSLERVGDMTSFAVNLLEREELKVTHVDRLLREASPEVQLRRGFSLVKNPEDGKFISSGAELKTGQEIEVEFFDTQRRAIVKG